MLRHPAPPAVRGLVEVKQGGVLARRVRRVASVEGGVLTLRGKPGAATVISVLDATIDARRAALSIAVRAGAVRVKLYVPTERKFDAWLRSLRASSRWKVSNFYALGNQIAQGQFATVHAASERVSADLVAVKVVRKPPREGCNPRVLQFIRREAYVCRVVEHAAIARVHDVFETPDALYIVMDHFPYTLHDVMAASHVLSEADAARILKPVLQAVRYLHQHRIVHRDIKPDNVLCKTPMAPFGAALCDFGLSNFTDPAAERAAHHAGNPELARRRDGHGSVSTAAHDARAFLSAATRAHPDATPYDDEYDDSPADSDSSDSFAPSPDAPDSSSALNALRDQQRAPRAATDQGAQSLSFGAFSRLRMRKNSRSASPEAGSPPASSSVSGASAFTAADDSWGHGGWGGSGPAGGRRLGAFGDANGGPPASARAHTQSIEPVSRRARQTEAAEYNVDASIFPSAIDGFTLTSAIGTPCYVAPEIVERERYGPPVDVWGCGLLLHLMLSGRLPFAGKDPSETLEAIRVCDLRLDEPDWADVSQPARALVRAMLQKDPRRRITVEQALAHAWLQEPPEAPRVAARN